MRIFTVFSHFFPFRKKCGVSLEFECEGARALELMDPAACEAAEVAKRETRRQETLR